MVFHCIALHPKGTVRCSSIPSGFEEPNTALAAAILKRATQPEKIGEWKWVDKTIHLFGYKTGKSGTENKHELPQPYDEIVLFGEVVLFATIANKLISFDSASYQEFYNSATGDQSDSESEEDEEEEEEAEEEEEEEAAAESSEDEEIVIESESEDEAPVKPRPKAAKKGTKKIAVWYSHTELKHEDTQGAIYNSHRFNALNIIKTRCTLLNNDEQQDLERGIYNASINEANKRGTRSVWDNPEFAILYDITLKRVVTNLDTTSYVGNVRLVERMKEGEFKPRDIPLMNYSELYPEKWVGLAEMAIKREAKMLEVDKSMATDMFKCSRCHKRQCTYYEMQTRSADEPMTQFIRCLNCGKQWRQ
jgi:DNA-directed RNA polymerase subunit M/transcription elongation factor TFIIS